MYRACIRISLVDVFGREGSEAACAGAANGSGYLVRTEAEKARVRSLSDVKLAVH